MKPQLLRMVLIFSLLINAGVLGAAAYRGLMADSFPGLPDYLGLSPAQTQQWHATEQDFLAQLAAGTQAIETHRVRLIEAIFAEVPDPARIDAERLAFAVDDLNLLIAGAESGGGVVHHRAGEVLGHTHPGVTVEKSVQ